MAVPFPRLDDLTAPRTGPVSWATEFDELLRPLESLVEEWSHGK